MLLDTLRLITKHLKSGSGDELLANFDAVCVWGHAFASQAPQGKSKRLSHPQAGTSPESAGRQGQDGSRARVIFGLVSGHSKLPDIG